MTKRAAFLSMSVRYGGLLCLFCVRCSADADWVRLEHCRFVDAAYNDADSFIVHTSRSFRGRKENRFRLYFVDAPETDMDSDFKQKRLREQAMYWGRDDPDVALQMGRRADRIVRRLLRGRFTVYTKGETAPTMGMPRYYALVRIDDRWLGEQLVEQGLARIYGKGTDLPDGHSEPMHWSRLKQLAREAKKTGRNGWHRADDPK